MIDKEDKGLLRLLALKDAIVVGLSTIIGASIFIVTGIAACVSGPANSYSFHLFTSGAQARYV